MTVIKYTQEQWNNMRFLQSDIRFMKEKNMDGKWDPAIMNESRMLRDQRRKIAQVA